MPDSPPSISSKHFSATSSTQGDDDGPLRGSDAPYLSGELEWGREAHGVAQPGPCLHVCGLDTCFWQDLGGDQSTNNKPWTTNHKQQQQSTNKGKGTKEIFSTGSAVRAGSFFCVFPDISFWVYVFLSGEKTVILPTKGLLL